MNDAWLGNVITILSSFHFHGGSFNDKLFRMISGLKEKLCKSSVLLIFTIHITGKILELFIKSGYRFGKMAEKNLPDYFRKNGNLK